MAAAIEGGMAPEALKNIVGHATYQTSVDKYGKELDIGYLKEQAEKGF